MPQIPFDILIQKAKQSLMSSNKYDTFSTEFRTSQPIPQIAPPGFMNVWRIDRYNMYYDHTYHHPFHHQSYRHL
jgi:hypothetical protein